jgi:hypothetical protein
VETLLQYGKLCLARGDTTTALHIFLKLVVVVTKHKEVRQCLASVIGGPGGLAALHDQLPPAAEGASAAFAFLAVILKVCVLSFVTVLGWAGLCCAVLCFEKVGVPLRIGAVRSFRMAAMEVWFLGDVRCARITDLWKCLWRSMRTRWHTT